MNVEIIEVTAEDVQELLVTEESHFLDLKAASMTPSSLTKTVAAFANTSGGDVFLGIEEVVGKKGVERVWRGFPNMEAANAILQSIEAMSPLGNHYEAEFLKAAGQEGLILHLTILKTRDIAYASNGKAYIRRSAQKLPVEGDEALQRLKYDKGLTSFEDELLDIESSEITNSAVIIDFLIRVVPSAEPDVWLSKQRLLVKERPAVAGVLLFSENRSRFSRSGQL